MAYEQESTALEAEWSPDGGFLWQLRQGRFALAEYERTPVLDNEVLRFEPDPEGRQVRVLVDLDGASFTESWLSAVEAARRR